MKYTQQTAKEKEASHLPNTKSGIAESRPTAINEMESDISPAEMQMLEQLETTPDSDDEQRVYLDDTDADGIKLNERTGLTKESGDDLDVPGSELDDADEEIGEEDEENNSYSQADTD